MAVGSDTHDVVVIVDPTREPVQEDDDDDDFDSPSCATAFVRVVEGMEGEGGTTVEEEMGVGGMPFFTCGRRW